MFDFKFDWKEDLNIGISQIDEQHKELFRIIRDMEQLLITRCIGVTYQQLYDIITQVREYVSYHFYEEEKMMEEYGYSLKEQHIKRHREFQQVIVDIDIPKLGEMPYEELKKLKDHAQDWVFEHMFNSDRHMGEEIARKKEQA